MTPASVPAPPASAPDWTLPAGACDAHSHIFGPFDRFPPLMPSVYALPEASPQVHAAIRQTLGVSRGVLTQPAPYADDPSAMLAAIAAAPDALRAVAVAAPDIETATLEHWRDAGIVGLRFTEMRTPGGSRYPGSVGFEALQALAPRMRALGLHAQLWAKASDIAAWLPRLRRLGVALVLDHMGCPDPSRGPHDPDFVSLLDALRAGDAWLKLTTCRVSPDRALVRPFHDALLGAAPSRLIWGSDWPYVRMEPAPDAGEQLDLLRAWTPDEALLHRILVENPAELYGFERSVAR